jgi:hypothetical protein
MDSATVFGSSSAIEKYYMFAFLQNDGFGTIGSDSNLLTDEKLQAFITNADFVTDFDTLVANGAVYFDNTGVPLNEVKHITDATVTKAFTDTTYTTGSAYVNMVDTNFYSFALVASDILDNVSTAFKRHYNLYKSLTDPQYIKDLNAIVVDDTLKVSNSGSSTQGAIVTNFEIQFTLGEVYHLEWDFELLYPENPSYTSTYGPHGGFSIGENMTVKYDNTDYRDFTVTGNRGFYVDYRLKTLRYLVGPTGNTTNLPMYSSSYAGYIWNKHITLEVVSTTQIRLSAYETSDRVGTPLWTGIMGTSSYSGTAPTADSTLTIGLWLSNYGNFYMTMGNFYNNIISTVLTTVSTGNTGITISGQVSGSMTVSSLTVTYYALATTTELTNAQVISLVHANKTLGDPLYEGLLITTKTQVTEILTDVLLPNVLDTSSGSYTIAPSSAVNNAFVYFYATNGSVSDDSIVKYDIVRDDDLPYATTSEVAEIAENDLTLVSGSVFSSVTSITKYYVVAFVTSAPSGSVVDTSTIDETTIASFITSLGTLSTTGYKTLFGATGNNMYYNEDGVAQYEVENIANVTVASAFTTLAPTATDGSEMVDITTTTGYRFVPYVIVVDASGNYGFQEYDNIIQISFKYNPGGRTENSSNTNILKFFLASSDGVLDDTPLLNIKTASNSWRLFQSELIEKPSNQFYLVWEVTHGTHVPDNGVYDINITNGSRIINFSFNDINDTQNFKTIVSAPFELSRMVDISPSLAWRVSNISGTNGPYTMVSYPGVPYLHYDGSGIYNITYLVSPLI